MFGGYLRRDVLDSVALTASTANLHRTAAAEPQSSHAVPMLQENSLQSALASLLRSQKEHIVALQHAIAQNHVANNVPLPPDLHACNGQAHDDPHAKAK